MYLKISACCDNLITNNQCLPHHLTLYVQDTPLKTVGGIWNRNNRPTTATLLGIPLPRVTRLGAARACSLGAVLLSSTVLIWNGSQFRNPEGAWLPSSVLSTFAAVDAWVKRAKKKRTCSSACVTVLSLGRCEELWWCAVEILQWFWNVYFLLPSPITWWRFMMVHAMQQPEPPGRLNGKVWSLHWHGCASDEFEAPLHSGIISTESTLETSEGIDTVLCAFCLHLHLQWEQRELLAPRSCSNSTSLSWSISVKEGDTLSILSWDASWSSNWAILLPLN